MIVQSFLSEKTSSKRFRVVEWKHSGQNFYFCETQNNASPRRKHNGIFRDFRERAKSPSGWMWIGRNGMVNDEILSVSAVVIKWCKWIPHKTAHKVIDQFFTRLSCFARSSSTNPIPLTARWELHVESPLNQSPKQIVFCFRMSLWWTETPLSRANLSHAPVSAGWEDLCDLENELKRKASLDSNSISIAKKKRERCLRTDRRGIWSRFFNFLLIASSSIE